MMSVNSTSTNPHEVNFKNAVSCKNYEVASNNLKSLLTSTTNPDPSNQQKYQYIDQILDFAPTDKLEEFGESVKEFLENTQYAKDQQIAFAVKYADRFKKTLETKEMPFEVFKKVINLHTIANYLSSPSSKFESRYDDVFMEISANHVFSSALSKEFLISATESEEKYGHFRDTLNRLNSFCTSERARNVLISKFGKGMEILKKKDLETKPCYTKCYDLLTQTPVIKPGARRYQNQLKEYRDRIRKPFTNLREHQREVGKAFSNLFKDIWFDACALNGVHPDGAEPRALGSVSRDEEVLFSDLEWFVLVEDSHLSTFQKVVDVVRLLFITLQETRIDCAILKHVIIPKKLSLDEQGNLPDTPENVAKTLQFKSQNEEDSRKLNTIEYTLLQSSPLYPREKTPLFDRFNQLVQSLLEKQILEHETTTLRQYRALHAMKSFQGWGDYSYHRNWNKPFYNKDTIDIKKDFTELIHHLISAFRLYFDIPHNNALDITNALVEKNIFTRTTGALFCYAIEELYKIRIKIQDSRNSTDEEVILKIPNDVRALDPSDLKTIECIYWFVLYPLYEHRLACLKNFIYSKEPINLFSTAFQQILDQPDEIKNENELEKNYTEVLIRTYNKTCEQYRSRRISRTQYEDSMSEYCNLVKKFLKKRKESPQSSEQILPFVKILLPLVPTDKLFDFESSLAPFEPKTLYLTIAERFQRPIHKDQSLKFYKKAVEYYTKVPHAPTEKFSNIFLNIARLHFFESPRFESILTRSVEDTKDFEFLEKTFTRIKSFCHNEDLREVFQGISYRAKILLMEGHRTILPDETLYSQLFSFPKIATPPSFIERYKQKFKVYQNVLQEPFSDINAHQKKVGEAFRHFFEEIWLDACALAGANPQHADPRAMGPSSKNEHHPLSRLQLLIISDEKHIDSFKTVKDILELLLMTLKETSIDDKQTLVGSPSQLKKQIESNHQILFHADSLYPPSPSHYHIEFQNLTKTKLQETTKEGIYAQVLALKKMEETIIWGNTQDPEQLHHVISSLGLYFNVFNLDTKNIINSLVNDLKMTRSTGILLQDTVDELYLKKTTSKNNHQNYDFILKTLLSNLKKFTEKPTTKIDILELKHISSEDLPSYVSKLNRVFKIESQNDAVVTELCQLVEALISSDQKSELPKGLYAFILGLIPKVPHDQLLDFEKTIQKFIDNHPITKMQELDLSLELAKRFSENFFPKAIYYFSLFCNNSKSNQTALSQHFSTLFLKKIVTFLRSSKRFENLLSKARSGDEDMKTLTALLDILNDISSTEQDIEILDKLCQEGTNFLSNLTDSNEVIRLLDRKRVVKKESFIERMKSAKSTSPKTIWPDACKLMGVRPEDAHPFSIKSSSHLRFVFLTKADDVKMFAEVTEYFYLLMIANGNVSVPSIKFKELKASEPIPTCTFEIESPGEMAKRFAIEQSTHGTYEENPLASKTQTSFFTEFKEHFSRYLKQHHLLRLQKDQDSFYKSLIGLTDSKGQCEIQFASEPKIQRFLSPKATSLLTTENLQKGTPIIFNDNNISAIMATEPPLIPYSISVLLSIMMGKTAPVMELARMKGVEYPLFFMENIKGKVMELGGVNTQQLTWLQLCSILIRPGNDKPSSFTVKNKHIYLYPHQFYGLDPVDDTHILKRASVQFNSAIFCRDIELEKDAVTKFCALDIDYILDLWIEDAIKKSNQLKDLFTKSERENIYKKGRLDSYYFGFFQEGFITSIRVQFSYLRERLLKKSERWTSLKLLKELILVKEVCKENNTVGETVSKHYANALKSYDCLEKRYESVLQNTKHSFSEFHLFGPRPSFNDLDSHKTLSAECAKIELNAIQHLNYKRLSCSLEGVYRKKLKDILLNTFLTFGQNKLGRFSIMHSEDISQSTLQYCLHDKITHLKLDFCKKVDDDVVLKIHENCRLTLQSFSIRGTSVKSLNPTSLFEFYLNKHWNYEFPELNDFDMSHTNVNEVAMKLPKIREWKAENCQNYLKKHLDHPQKIKLYTNCQWHFFYNLGKELSKLQAEKSIDLSESNITDIKFFKDLKVVESLNFKTNHISCIPNIFESMTQLKSLNLSHNKLTDIPNELTASKNIDVLHLNNNCIEKITGNIENMAKLKKLYLGNNSFSVIPQKIGCCKTITELYLNNNQISNISFDLSEMKVLEILDLSSNEISEVTDHIINSKTIKHLVLSNNRIKLFAKSLESMTSLEVLDLSSNFLEKVPKEVTSAKTIKELNFKNNQITDVEGDLRTMKVLEVLNLAENKLTKSPQVGYWTNLEINNNPLEN